MILTSKVRTSASKKIKRMALIRTISVSTITFKRTKENSMVFGRLYVKYKIVLANLSVQKTIEQEMMDLRLPEFSVFVQSPF